MAARHDRAEVLHQHRGVQRVAAEAAPDEERPALAQEAPDDRQVEVDAGGDVRHRIALHVDHVAEQQVVHVAAVTGHVDDLVALGDLLERRRMAELDAVVEPVPQPRERAGHEAHEGVRVVRGDLQRVRAGAQHAPCGAAVPCRASPAPRPRAPRRVRSTSFTMVRRCERSGPMRAARRRAYSARRVRVTRRPRCATCRSAPSRVRSESGSSSSTSVSRPLKSTCRNFCSRRGEHPVLHQQQAQPGCLALWGAPPVDRHRHQGEIRRRVRAQHADHLRQLRRGMRRGTGAPEPARLGQIEVGTLVLQRAAQAPPGPRQFQRQARLLQHRQVGDAAALEHIADRMAAALQQGRRVLRPDPKLHPECEHSPQQPVHRR